MCPFVGGLFGALSHEYADFSSLRRRNKALQLRRSFYSLDDLRGAESRKVETEAGCEIALEPGELPTLSGTLTGKRRAGSTSSESNATSSMLTLADDLADRKCASISYSRQLKVEQARLARRLRAERARMSRRTSTGEPSPLNYESNFLVRPQRILQPLAQPAGCYR